MTGESGKGSTFRVGLIQTRSGRSPAANLEAVVKLIGEAKEGGACYVQTPEMTNIMEVSRDKLLAATHDLEGMRQFIGADSLAFLSVEGIYKAMGYEGRDPARPQFTDHCFTGEYPTGLTDQTGAQATPRQLSLLAEAG